MNPGVRGRIKAKRELVKRGYGNIYEVFHAILLRHNPVALDVERGDARDDYGGPVGTLIPRLQKVEKGDLTLLLHQEMTNWYGKEAGAASRYEGIASEMCVAWEEFRKKLKS